MAWQLTAEGRVPWAQFRAALPADAIGVWSDIDGFHVDTPPATLDGATHVWIAAPGVSWRLRVDGTSVIGARLEQSAGGDTDARVVAVEPRQTPDPGLKRALEQAGALQALAVSGPAGDAWFVAVRS